MTDSQLDKLLKRVPAPERAPDYWENFPWQVTGKLRRPAAPRCQPQGRRMPRLAWAGGLALVCLVLGFALGHWRGAAQTDSSALLQNKTVLREILTLFPNRVRAIVQTEQGVQLVLSDNPDVPVSTPLWIKVGEGRQAQAAVTFSGQKIQIAGQELTVLADAHGGIILEGEGFAWSTAPGIDAKNKVRIEAKSLGSLRM